MTRVLKYLVLLVGCGASEPGLPIAPARCASEPPRVRASLPSAAPAAAPAAAPEPAPTDEPGGFDDGPLVSRGSCDTSFLPAGTKLDLSDEEAADVREQIRTWLAGGPESPVLDGQRGIVFAKSEDDRGDDPPYPRHAGARSERACGLHAAWLRSHVREVFARSAAADGPGVSCDENVCCFEGMEYVPDAGLVLRPRDPDGRRLWVIESFYWVAEATLGEPYVEANRRYVGEQLRRHARGVCRGEPPGLR